MLLQQRDTAYERSELLSGLVSVSAREVGVRGFAQTRGTTQVKEIEVKKLAKPIKLEIPLTAGVQDPDRTYCMFLNESTNKW